MGLNVLSNDGVLFDFVDFETELLLYGLTNDAISYSKYLIATGYRNLVFVDRNRTQRDVLSIPVITPEEIDNTEKKHILLMAKTETVCNEMVEKLDELQVEGNVYTWRAFCIDTRKYPKGQEVFSMQQFIASMPWFYYDIFGEGISPEFCEKIYSPNQIIRIYKNSYCRPIENHSQYWNFDENGRRHTVGQPIKANQTLYFFGDSRILGIGVEDKDTIPSYLQERINEDGLSVRVENCSLSDTTIDNLFAWMQDVDMQSEDIVCFSCDLLYVYTKDKEILKGLDEEYYYIYWLKKIYAYCNSKNIKFYYILNGGLAACKFNNNTLAEKTILALIKISNGKKYLLRRNHEKILACMESLGVETLDARDVLRNIHGNMNCFVDTGHYSPNACKVIADKIFQLVFHSQEDQEVQRDKLNVLDEYMVNVRLERVFRFVLTDEWEKYVDELRRGKVNVSQSGAIVMNANPFTKGHRYLVEYAAKKVEHLYVFVLEENSSYFSFEDRFRLVKEGTRDLHNVTVFRGGEFIISKKTFPEYFEKVDSVANSSKDIEIFGRLIAPILDIKSRFVGKEPYSVVTNGYNEQMKKMLPEFGISLVEIERTDVDGEIISATKVRKACENKDIETLRAMLPATTFDFVRDKCLLGEV